MFATRLSCLTKFRQTFFGLKFIVSQPSVRESFEIRTWQMFLQTIYLPWSFQRGLLMSFASFAIAASSPLRTQLCHPSMLSRWASVRCAGEEKEATCALVASISSPESQQRQSSKPQQYFGQVLRSIFKFKICRAKGKLLLFQYLMNYLYLYHIRAFTIPAAISVKVGEKET